MRATWTAPLLALSALVTPWLGCGARDALDAPLPGSDGGAPDAAGTPEGGVPECPIECFVGHGCCAGGCGGPALVEDTCCACPAGSVSTFDCGEATCGGG